MISNLKISAMICLMTRSNREYQIQGEREGKNENCIHLCVVRSSVDPWPILGLVSLEEEIP